ncbi:MAG: protein kinase, partial [Solirubrobacterales bacterium]|nr:protein kinase [Solirubrobacterales bacterium]
HAMSRHDRAQMTVETQRELAAIDAALAGEAVAATDAPLAELSRELQTMRPRPTAEFVRTLDARAAGGFERERPRSANEAPHRAWGWRRALQASPSRRRRVLLTSAAGAAVTVVLVAVLAASQLRSGGGEAGPRPERAGPAFSAPAVRGPAVSAPTRPSSGASAARAANGDLEAPGGGAASAPGAAARQVERTSTLDVGVAPGAVESAAQRVFTLVSSFKGYVRQSNVGSGAGEGGASFDVRLPTSSLSAAIAALSHLGRVRSENDTTNDVTDQFGSLQRSLADLRAERASLLRQLAAAADAQRAAALKAQLHAVEARIAQSEGQLRSLVSRIDYTALSLSLTPEAGGAATPGDLTPGGAARNAAQILEAALAVVVIGAAAVFPVALLALAGAIAVAVTRRRLRERALDAR